MAYFKINDTDYSHIVNELVVAKAHNYNSQTNAAGNTVVDYINAKRTIEVGIIPLNAVELAQFLSDVDRFNVNISFINPLTNELEEDVSCIIPENEIEYYTIQANKVMINAFKIKIIEL